jgi:hypothetical protein
MKNLPDNEWMKELEGRLRSYNEQPDEAVWDAIAQTVQPQREAAVWKWLEYAGSGAVVLLAIFLLTNGGEESGLVLNAVEKTDAKILGENTITAITRSTNSSFTNAAKEDVGLQKNKNERTNSSQVRNLPIAIADKMSIENSAVVTVLDLSAAELDNSFASTNEMPRTAVDTILTTKENVKADTVAPPIKKNEQERAKSKTKRKPLTLYAQLTPSLSYYAVQPFGSDEVAISSFNSSSVLSSDRFGFAGEVGIQRKLSRKFIYTVGLTLYQQTQTLRYQTVSQSQLKILNSPSEPFSYSTIPQHNEHTVRYDMVNAGLTAGLLYELKNAGLFHRIGLSGSYQQGVKKSTEASTYSNAKSSYAFYTILYRIEYPVNEKLTFYVQPTFTRSLNVNENLAEPFSLKLSRAGIGVGLVFDF